MLAVPTWLLIAAAFDTASSAAIDKLLGVAPEHRGKYGGDSFKCFDGLGPALPASAVNDEFCDCADGSDEPGTGACAGQSVTHFYCANDGSTPRKLYASRVGDGVCDCCDGSDEMALARRAGKGCPNTCAEQGAREKEAAKQRIEDLRRALNAREEARSKALVDRETSRSAIAALEAELPALEERLRAAEAAAEAERAAAKAKEEEAAARDKKALEEAFGTGECMWRQTAGCHPDGVREEANDMSCTGAIGAGASGYCDCDGDGKRQEREPGFECESPRSGTCAEACLHAAKGEAQPEAKAPEAAPDAQATEAEDGKEKPQVSEYAKWMDGAEEAAKEEKPQVSEYAKWMDGAADAMGDGEDKEEAEEAQATEGAPDATQKSASEEESEARTKISSHKDKIAKMQANLDALPDDKLVYASLVGKTLEKKVGEFKYKVTFFTSAMQDHTSLGRWSKWTGRATAEFDHGTMCWGGPERKMLIAFQCGVEEALLDVLEPSRCVYEGVVSHPGACEQKDLDELVEGTRVVGVRDEL